MTKPNKYNISLGDILIVPLGKCLEWLTIIQLNENNVLASNGVRATGCSYEEAIVRKRKDGGYLIGENAEKRLLNGSFGGIRLKTNKQ